MLETDAMMFIFLFKIDLQKKLCMMSRTSELSVVKAQILIGSLNNWRCCPRTIVTTEPVQSGSVMAKQTGSFCKDQCSGNYYLWGEVVLWARRRPLFCSESFLVTSSASSSGRFAWRKGRSCPRKFLRMTCWRPVSWRVVLSWISREQHSM